MATPSPLNSPEQSSPSEIDLLNSEDHDDILEVGKENLQGPHDWRKRLKPIYRDSSQDDGSETQGQDEVEETGAGKSPPEKEKSATLVRRLSREDKLEDSKIRERLKAMPAWKKDLVNKKSRNVGNVPGASKKKHPHVPTESAFTRQVVNKATSPSIGRRKNNHLISSNVPSTQPRLTISAWDKKVGAQAMVASGRRASSVAQDVSGATAKRRVEKVLKARLYLLQQNGPNSFLIGGDSPDHKYRVVIGPQQCSCSRTKHCVHVMFVMLRVFQVSENDPCLWSRTLKNYEVENLFRTYRARRSSLIQNQNLGLRKKKVKEETEVESKSSEQPVPNTDVNDEVEEHKDEHDEEDTCPICLLEMVEGESLTECVNGCQNKFHHHCIAVWFEECRRQTEPLICPLCRANWRTDVDNPEGSACPDLPVPPNTRVSSPSHEPHEAQAEANVMLPPAEPIPPEHKTTAEQWIPVLGEELVSCLFSKNWLVREIAVKQLGPVANGTLLLGVGEGRAGVVVSPDRQATTRQMLETCCSVLAYICADPVYKVFVATLRTLRLLLAFTPCRDESQQNRLQLLMKPVIDGILLKCADSNKRTSQLSLSAMQELLRGQEGELCVGREIVNRGHLGLGGLPYILDCVAQEYDPQVQFQWLLGRLYVLNKLLEEQPSEFLLQAPESGELSEKQLPLEDYENYERVMRILRFTRGALENPHQKVAKVARNVFYQIARLNSHSPAVLKHVTDLLDTLGLNIQVQLKRKLLTRMTSDFHFTQRASKYFETESEHLDAELLSNTPLESDASTPRSASPLGASATPPRISVTVNNFVSGNLNFVPLAPPNSPERRRGPDGRSKSGTSGTETDSSMSGCASVMGVDVTDGIELPKPQDICHASTPRKLEKSFHHERKPSKVDVSVSTSPTVSVQGINLNLTSHMNESSTDDLEEVSALTMTIDDELGVMVNGSEDVCAAGELSSIDGEQEALHNNTIDSLTQAGNHHCTGGDASSSVSSTDATAASGSSNGLLSEDLSDPNESSGGGEFHVSFKTEVATNSPSHSSATRLPLMVQNMTTPHKEQCACKEEVEKEEAQALAAAMAQSDYNQQPLPFIPGLSKEAGNSTVTIRVQDSAEQPNGERLVMDPLQTSSSSCSATADGMDGEEYLEGKHWFRGPMLGTGAFSTCYQARDSKTGSLMAVKQISFCRNSVSEQEEVVQTVRQEIQMMSRLNHPNIIRILGATQQACHFFMFVEWMPGGSLAYLLDRYGRFCENVIIKYTQQLLLGLSYLHELHILHRDLKGANILVDSTGQRIRIGDFGASARLASRQTAAGEFQGQLLGTIAFMAPEVLRGESYGRTCDVWSVGCVMIEMATRKPPWGATDLSNHLALIFMIASSEDPPPIPENLSPPVRDLLLRCLECQREHRPQAKELLKHPLFTMMQKS